MLRASEACERAGFPTSSLVCEGFLGQAAATSVGLGMPNLPVATIVGHPGAQNQDELRANVFNVTAKEVIDNLLQQPDQIELAPEPAPHDIVFRGTFEEVNAYFYERQWSDGLPIVPPTVEKINEFLSYTDRDPDEVIGVVLPASKPRPNGLRPLSGNSRICLFWITWPSDEVSDSSSGVDARTSTISRTSPGVSVTRMVAL